MNVHDVERKLAEDKQKLENLLITKRQLLSLRAALQMKPNAINGDLVMISITSRIKRESVSDWCDDVGGLAIPVNDIPEDIKRTLLMLVEARIDVATAMIDRINTWWDRVNNEARESG